MIHTKGLDLEVIQILKDLLDKPISELDADERAFLKARSYYLTEAEKSGLMEEVKKVKR